MVAYVTVSEDILPDVNFSADETTPCGGNIVHFTDLTLNCPSAWTWQFGSSNITFLEGTDEHSQNPVVQFDESGTYTVTLIAENANGTGNLSKQNYIKIGGVPLPYTEDFEGGSFQDLAWTVENPDMEITWAITDVEGNSPGNQAAWMNLFDYYKFGPRDMLISPPLDFTSFNTIGTPVSPYRISIPSILLISLPLLNPNVPMIPGGQQKNSGICMILINYRCLKTINLLA